MKSRAIKPQNFPETIVWFYLISTYIIYLLGAHYLLTPFMGCLLLLYLGKKWWYQTEATPLENKIIISPLAWFWVATIIIIEIALVVGHLNFELGISQVIKSSSHWFRTWAIFAIFPLVGHLKIRPEIIYRAVCIVCLQSIIITIIGTLASLSGIGDLLYVSPLAITGGNIEHYQVHLIHTVIGERLSLFAPWSTALGMGANIYFLFACQESERTWKLIGIVGSIMMIIFSFSRLAIVSLPAIFITVWFLTKITLPRIHFAMSIACFLGGLFSVNLINFLDFFKQTVDSIRKDSSSSSEVRNKIYSLTLDHWRREAPIWGHGINAEKGPQVLANMPIGSHHTWFGLLYTHGLVGFIPFVVAVIWTLIDLLIKAQNSREAKLGLGIMLIILISSFTDNIQVFAYMYWTALMMLGIIWSKSSNLEITRKNAIILGLKARTSY
jgi:hypothetical protein